MRTKHILSPTFSAPRVIPRARTAETEKKANSTNQVIYHLRGAVPRLHETYCPHGQPGLAHVTGIPGEEAELKIFKLQASQPRR